MAVMVANQMPSTRWAGMVGGGPSQGSGKCQTESTLAAAAASTTSLMQLALDSTDAATVTGASSSSANGFWSPPVRNSSRASCKVSKARKPKACGSGRPAPARWCRLAYRLTAADMATTAAAASIGSRYPKPKWTTSTVPACPATATQRISTSVRVCTMPVSPRGGAGSKTFMGGGRSPLMSERES